MGTRRSDAQQGAASGCRLGGAGRQERPGDAAPAWLHSYRDGSRGDRAAVEVRPHREVERIEGVRRSPRAQARPPHVQHPGDVEEPERSALRRPHRYDPARRIEREREHVQRPLDRGSLGVAESDTDRAGRELRAGEAEEHAQLAGPGHERIVPLARTRGQS